MVQLADLKFWFQYRYRHSSVSYIFKKELICALALVVVFQFINFTYLSLFKASKWANASTDAEKERIVQEQIDTYTSVNFIGTIFAATMLYSVLCKVLFNALSEVRLAYDRWTLLDLLTSVVSLVCFR